jgi:hypothetical protein
MRNIGEVILIWLVMRNNLSRFLIIHYVFLGIYLRRWVVEMDKNSFLIGESGFRKWKSGFWGGRVVSGLGRGRVLKSQESDKWKYSKPLVKHPLN